MKRLFTFFIFTFAFCIGSVAQIPNKLSYQGLLTTLAGVPVQDGSYDLQFDLYNALTGGTLRYSETQTSVIVQRGTFSVSIGTVTPLSSIFTEPLFVEISALAGPGISSTQTFSPRSELTSAPYSLAPWAPNGSNIFYTQGNVGIGTSSPISNLQIGLGNNVYTDNVLLGQTMPMVPRRFNIVDNSGVYAVGLAIENQSSNTNFTGTVISMHNPNVLGGVNGEIIFGVNSFGTGNPGGLMGTLTPHPFAIRTDSISRLYIKSDGDIGIGTTTPSYKLDVNGIINATDIYKNGVPFSGGTSQWTTSGSDIYFNSGNVGLGTSSPARNLHISQNDYANAQGITIENLGADNTFTGTVIEFRNPNVTAGATNGNINIGRNTFGAGIPGGSIGMETNHPFSIKTNGSHRLYVSASGNIGIGTINPSDKFSIIDNATVQQSLRSLGSTSAATFRINNDVDEPFDFQSFGSAYSGTRITGINAAGLNELSSQGSNGLLIRNWSSKPIYFATNSLERMRISGSGDVGIGTTSPLYKLDVNGIINATDIYKNGVPFNGGIQSSASVDLSADFLLSTGSFVWNDITGMSITLVVGSNGTVQINFIGTVWNWDGTGYPSGTPSSLATPSFGIKVDSGSEVRYSSVQVTVSGNSQYLNPSFSTLITGLSAGIHTFQLRYLRETTTTSTLLSASGTGFVCRLSGFALN